MQTMIRKRSKLSRVAPIACLSLIPLYATAQNDSNSEEEEIFELSPFVVDGKEDVGYYAPNSLAGSRLNSSLKDIAASVSVLNKQMIDDLGASDTEELLRYSINTQRELDPDTGGFVTGNDFFDNSISLRMRGQTSGGTSRNYFRWFINGDSYNVERVDISRGPNSILFGVASAAGTINSTTNRAFLDNTFNKVSLEVDENGGARAIYDTNQSLDETFALRANVLLQEGESWRDLGGADKQFLYLAGTYQPAEKTILRFDFETGSSEQAATRPWQINDYHDGYEVGGITEGYNNALTYVENTGAIEPLAGTNQSHLPIPWRWDGGTRGLGLANFWAMPLESSEFPRTWTVEGPGSYVNQDFTSASLYWEQQWTEKLRSELSYNTQEDDRPYRNTTGWTQGLRIDPNATWGNTTASNEYFESYFTDSRLFERLQDREADDLRATISYQLDLAEQNDFLGDHIFTGLYQKSTMSLFTQDFSEYNLNGTGDLTTGANQITRRTYLDPMAGGSASQIDYPEPINSGGVTSGMLRTRSNWSDEDLESVLFAGQSHFLNRTLTLTYGWRNDQLDLLSRNVREGDGAGATNARGEALDAREAVLVNGSDPAITDTLDVDTTTFGAVYYPIEWLGFGFNTSETASPQRAAGPRDALGASMGDSDDFSVRVNMGSKFYATATYFETAQTNVANFPNGGIRGRIDTIQTALMESDSDPDTDGVQPYLTSPIVAFTGSQDTTDSSSEGWEFEVTANPTENWTITGSYSSTETTGTNIFPRYAAIYEELATDFGPGGTYADADLNSLVDPLESEDTVPELYELGLETLAREQSLAGYAPRGHVEDKFTLFTNYRLSDTGTFLDNANIGGGARYNSGRLLDLITPNDLDAATGLTSVPITEQRYQYESGSELYFDLVFGYQMEIWEGDGLLKFQFNIDNVFNEDELIIADVDQPVANLWNVGQPSGSDPVINSVTPMRFIFPEPRTMKLRVSLEF